MPRINNQNRKADLAVVLASGGTVKEWAKAHGVPERTAHAWSQAPEVLEQVEAMRRQVVHQTVGQLCGQATAAVAEIARLMTEGNSESVRLQAARAVLADLMAVSSFAALNGRMAELERVVREGARPSAIGTAPGADPCAAIAGQATDGPSRGEDPSCRA